MVQFRSARSVATAAPVCAGPSLHVEPARPPCVTLCFSFNKKETLCAGCSSLTVGNALGYRLDGRVAGRVGLRFTLAWVVLQSALVLVSSLVQVSAFLSSLRSPFQAGGFGLGGASSCEFLIPMIPVLVRGS